MSARTKSAAEEIISILEEPFDDAIVKKNDDGFSSTRFGHYLEKILKTRGVGATVEVTHPYPAYILKAGDFTSVVQPVRIKVEAEGFSGVGDGAGVVSVDQLDTKNDNALNMAIKAADGDGIKRAALKLGVNLDLYCQDNDEEEKDEPRSRTRSSSRRERSSSRSNDDDAPAEEPEEEKPRTRSSERGSSRPSRVSSRGSSRDSGKQNADNWDGEQEISFGTYEGTKWKDIHGSWLKYMTEGDKPRDEVFWEIDRRGDDYDPEEKDPKFAKKGNRGGGPTRRESGRRSGRGLASGDRGRDYD